MTRLILEASTSPASWVFTQQGQAIASGTLPGTVAATLVPSLQTLLPNPPTPSQILIGVGPGSFSGIRSAIASAVLAAATIATVFTDVVIAKWADVPAGIVHFVILLLYFALASFIVMVIFAYEDYFAALGQFTIFLIMPIIVLLPINALLGMWNFWLKFFDGWLKVVT